MKYYVFSIQKYEYNKNIKMLFQNLHDLNHKIQKSLKK